MTKTNGTRGKGEAMFIWMKTANKYEALAIDTLAYLTELAQIRTRIFDGKVRSAEKTEALWGRHEEVVGILGGFHEIEVRFPRQRVAH